MKPFEKNSRVTFLGDSITATNNYSARIADYYFKNLRELGVKFTCAGVSGGSASSGLLYLESDLLPSKPDYVTIMFGVNDSRRDLLASPDSPEREAALNAAFENYKAKMSELIDRLTTRGIEVILCTPAPYAEFAASDMEPLPGGHALIQRYAEEVRRMAREKSLEFVDFHARLSELYLDEPIYGPDHVHPNDAGHARMAECFLTAQGLSVRDWKRGESAEPFTPEIAEWRAVVSKIRNIYNSEWLIIRNFSLSTEQKLAIIDDYIANEKWGDRLFFKNIATDYRESKPIETELVKRASELMDALYV